MSRLQAHLAHRIDSSGALLMAFRRGEPWARRELCGGAALDFYRSFFDLPENQQGADALAILGALFVDR